MFSTRNRLKASREVESVDLPNCHLIKGIGMYEKMLAVHGTVWCWLAGAVYISAVIQQLLVQLVLWPILFDLRIPVFLLS